MTFGCSHRLSCPSFVPGHPGNKGGTALPPPMDTCSGLCPSVEHLPFTVEVESNHSHPRDTPAEFLPAIHFEPSHPEPGKGGAPGGADGQKQRESLDYRQANFGPHTIFTDINISQLVCEQDVFNSALSQDCQLEKPTISPSQTMESPRRESRQHCTKDNC